MIIGSDNLRTTWTSDHTRSCSTLKTNISRLKKATVLKLPSQMLGFPFPGRAGLSPDGGRGGRDWCFLSEVECVRRDGSVGSGRVGSNMAVGIPVRGQRSTQEQSWLNKQT